MNSPTEVTIVLHDPRGRDEAWWLAELQDEDPNCIESGEIKQALENLRVEVITVEVQ